jgi:hypothetical protein
MCLLEADDLPIIGRFLKRRKWEEYIHIQKVGRKYRLTKYLIFRPPRKGQFQNATGTWHQEWVYCGPHRAW